LRQSFPADDLQTCAASLIVHGGSIGCEVSGRFTEVAKPPPFLARLPLLLLGTLQNAGESGHFAPAVSKCGIKIAVRKPLF
jgi:hypothetical protein